MHTATAKSPALSFQSLVERQHVPRKMQNQATPKLELWMISSAGLTSSRVLPSPSRRAAAAGGGACGWMGQKAGWCAGPKKLHAKTTKLPRPGQFRTFTFQPR